MATVRFEHNSIESLKAGEKEIELFDTNVKGLGLRVSKSGHKSFFYRYRFYGKIKRFTIGGFQDISLKKARAKARSLRTAVTEGNDPQGEKQARRTVIIPKTFNDLATEFKFIHFQSLRPKTISEHTRIIDNELIPVFGRLPIEQVDKGKIIAFLDRKAIKDGKKTMANRIRARLHSIFEFGIHRDIVKINPVTSIRKYTEGEVKRERYYSEDEIKKLWAAFEKQAEPMQSVFKMLLICGQRSKETRHMRWDHIQRGIWIIPAELSKSNREHQVPLPALALGVIEKLKPWTSQSDYVFESPRIKSQPVEWLKRAVKQVREEKDSVPDFRLHDLRRTAATHMAGLNIDRTVLGKILNHKGLAGDGQVTAIYDRHEYLEEKRQALDKWSTRLIQIIMEKNV